MSTRCPKCDTQYRVDEDMLLKANCLAHCYRCGALFTVIGKHAAEIETADIAADDFGPASGPAQRDPAHQTEGARPRHPSARCPACAPRADRAEDAATHKPSTIDGRQAPTPHRLRRTTPQDDHQSNCRSDAGRPRDPCCLSRCRPGCPGHRFMRNAHDAAVVRTAHDLPARLGLQLAWQPRRTAGTLSGARAAVRHVTCRRRDPRTGQFRILQRDTSNRPRTNRFWR